MKGPLRGFTIAVTGDFGEQRGHDKIRQWIHVNGGSFAHGIRNEVTHLVCSTKHFKTNIKMGICDSFVLDFLPANNQDKCGRHALSDLSTLSLSTG